MSDDDRKLSFEPPAPAPPPCKRCGGTTEFTTFLPKLVASAPAYDIFRCAACGFIDWVPLP